MGSYRKGYMAERELVLKLSELGWAVIRAPRSGRMGIPLPDVVAIRSGRVLSFEVKSRKPGFKMREEQLKELEEWRERSGTDVFIALKLPYKGWVCLHLNDIIGSGGNVSNSLVVDKSFPLESLIA